MIARPPADDRLRLLFELSTLVGAFEGDHTIGEVLAVTARALPVCTAALAFTDEAGAFRPQVWKADGVGPDHAADALSRARDAYAWFTGVRSRRAARAGSAPNRFVALPLVVQRGHVLGVLQVEAEGDLAEGDVFFVNAAANLLATAIDRRVATENAEARVRAQLQLTGALTGSLGEGVVAADTEARITFVNPAAEVLLGWTETTVIGRHAPEVLRVQRADGTELGTEDCPLVRALGADAPIVSDEQSFLGRDGVAVPVSYTAAPIRNDGRVGGAVIVFRDVLAVKRSERTQRLLASASSALAESLDYRATLAALVSCTVPAFADRCFIDEIEEAGSTPAARATHRAHVMATGRAVLVASVAPAVPEDEDAPPHSKLIGASGAKSLIVVPLSVRGRTFGTLTFGMAESGRRFTADDLDVAEELGRRAATAIDNARLHRSLQDAVRDREDLLAIVSHELRNPLNTVSMAAASLLSHLPATHVPHRERGMLELIARAGKRMERMTNDLLDLSSIEAGHLTVNPAPTPVTALIADVLEALAAAAASRGLHLVARAIEGPLVVRCDRDRILQALSNLVGNAIKFTPTGGRIELSVEPADAFVHFTVTDTGPGIARDLVPHVFDRYRQAAETASKGRGLGLFITKGIIEAHGGSIGVDSAPGVGTTFFFELPRVASTMHAAREA